MHLIKHWITITRHRHKVMGYCISCGLYKQGLLHDLSKYSPIEFFNGAKYYAGVYSPHFNERKNKGYSEAWMHHKGRNKHHCEYWIDADPKSKIYVPVEMPNRYIAESLCDRIAATKIYNGSNFEPKQALEYFYKEKDILPMHEHTKWIMEHLLKDYVKHGQKYIFKYIRKNKKKKDFGYTQSEGETHEN